MPTGSHVAFKNEVEKLSDGKFYTQEGGLTICREGSFNLAYFLSWLAKFPHIYQ